MTEGPMELQRALEQAIEALEAGAELDWSADQGFHNDNKDAAAVLRAFMEKGLPFYRAAEEFGNKRAHPTKPLYVSDFESFDDAYRAMEASK